jgi:hypothetical protein
MRCRRSAQHQRRAEPSASAERLEAQLGETHDRCLHVGRHDRTDYREQLRGFQDQLERLDTAPDERRMITAIRLAQDLSATWERARQERRTQLIAELFETIRVGVVASCRCAEAGSHAACCFHGWWDR